MKKLFLGLLLGILAACFIGCVRPEPDRPPEIVEETNKTIKEPYEPVMPGE